MTRERRRWQALLPARESWWRLLTAPSSYFLVLAVAITIAIKVQIARGLDGGSVLDGIAASTADLGFYLTAGALLALAEHRVRRVFYVTIPIAFVLLGFAAANAVYLSISGEQLTWPVISIGLERFDDVSWIASELSFAGPAACAVTAALAFGALLFVTRKRGHSICPRSAGVGRAHALGLIAVPSVVLAVLSPAPREYALARLHPNAPVRTYAGLVGGGAQWTAGPAGFAGYTPHATALAAATRPNILVIILESTGREATTLARADAIAQTPNLVRLAARGTEVTTTRAVLPHTTKSVFSILCGQLPLMQTQLLELSSAIEAPCLPGLLDRAGWRTGFFQSATGAFEDRPRLAHRLGFHDFAAREDLGGAQLGYVAGEDDRLVEPLLGWIDQGAAQPFFATVLTSSTHHDYVLSAGARSRLGDRPASTDRDRYARLVEEEDLAVGRILDGLTTRGLIESTIVIVVGDHGEGFGDKGIRQHDNNFFEEGLRVPWVMAGPAIPHGRIAADASLVDVVPTVLELIGQPPSGAALVGTSVLHPRAGRLVPFSCYYEGRCRGFVRDGKKVVFIPELDQAFWFDLARDPHERSPQPLTEELRLALATLHALIDAHRSTAALVRGTASVSAWTCPASQTCTHTR